MKPINTLVTVLFISLLSSHSWSETMDDLVKREDIYYQKFTDVPFSGKTTGEEQGSIKNGKREGAWFVYHKNGQLANKGSYKNGKLDGAWVFYSDNGQFFLKGNYNDGNREGAWVSYYENGQLQFKYNYKNGQKEGAGVWFNEDGTVDKERTGTFKNGEKISD